MSGNMVYDKLCQCFQNVNDWLKFAEAKNGVLFAFNGATIIGLLSLYKELPVIIKDPVLLILVPSLILSLVVLLISFVPIRDKFFRNSTENINVSLNDLNLIYYGDIRNLSVLQYLKLFYESLDHSPPESYPKLEKDLTQQILNNSAITYNKFTFFTVCTYINLLGLYLSIVFLLIKLICTLYQ